MFQVYPRATWDATSVCTKNGGMSEALMRFQSLKITTTATYLLIFRWHHEISSILQVNQQFLITVH